MSSVVEHRQGHVNDYTVEIFIHKSQKLKVTYHMMNSTHNVVSSHGEILPAHKQQ